MYCGVTLLRPGDGRTLASSDHAALKLDKIQHTLSDGPCLTAARTHELVHVTNTRTDSRWPEYLQEITDHGIHSTLSVPILLINGADCTLNLYSNTIDGFTAGAISAAQDFANEASRSLQQAVQDARTPATKPRTSEPHQNTHQNTREQHNTRQNTYEHRGVTATLQTLVLESDAIQDFLDRLAHYAADRLSSPQQAVMCGITLLRDRTHATVASSSNLAQAMDEVQYTFGDGPCLDAARHQHTNHLPDITDITDGDARWPEYRAVNAGHGLRSILSVPIPLDSEGSSSCAINMYAETAHAFSAQDIETTERLAAEAGDTVRIAVRLAHLSDTTAHLTAAMESRTAIDLATGILMAQHRCSQQTARSILEAASTTRNLELHDLAVTLIASITADPTTTHFDR